MDILFLILQIGSFILLAITFLLIVKQKKNISPTPIIPQTPAQTIIKNPDKTALNYKLQAYERLILFCERMYPPQLILKTYNANFSVKEMQAILNETIQKELEHNITQQIYVNHKVWKWMITVKDNHLFAINAIADGSKNLSPAMYVKKIIEYYDGNELREQHLLLLDAIQQEAKLILK